jgi:hypothetical protein
VLTIASNPPAQLAPTDSLVVLLTIQTLLLAVFSVGAALGARDRYGQMALIITPLTLGIGVTGTMLVTSAGATLALFQAYHFSALPWTTWAQGAAIGIGIVAELAVAMVVTLSLPR